MRTCVLILSCIHVLLSERRLGADARRMLMKTLMDSVNVEFFLCLRAKHRAQQFGVSASFSFCVHVIFRNCLRFLSVCKSGVTPNLGCSISSTCSEACSKKSYSNSPLVIFSDTFEALIKNCSISFKNCSPKLLFIISRHSQIRFWQK